MTYIPEWARDDSPTRAMSEAEMRSYYKRTAPLGDARFYLDALTLPDDLRTDLQTLVDEMTPKAAAGKTLGSPYAAAVAAWRRRWHAHRRNIGSCLERLGHEPWGEAIPSAVRPPVAATVHQPSKDVTVVTTPKRQAPAKSSVDWAAAGRKAWETRQRNLAAKAAAQQPAA